MCCNVEKPRRKYTVDVRKDNAGGREWIEIEADGVTVGEEYFVFYLHGPPDPYLPPLSGQRPEPSKQEIDRIPKAYVERMRTE